MTLKKVLDLSCVTAVVVLALSAVAHGAGLMSSSKLIELAVIVWVFYQLIESIYFGAAVHATQMGEQVWMQYMVGVVMPMTFALVIPFVGIRGQRTIVVVFVCSLLVMMVRTAFFRATGDLRVWTQLKDMVRR